MIISFDVWGTLIKSNPIFAEEKVTLLRHWFPEIKASRDLIKAAYKKVKNESDHLVEQYGIQPNRLHLFAQILAHLEVDNVKFEYLKKFDAAYQELFLDNIPTAIPGTSDVLSKIVAKKHLINISSNTLLISGDSLSTAISRIFPGLFSMQLYSDVLGCSKPSGYMFFIGSTYHVGDNPKTDGGCEDFGINFYQINSNNKTIKDFYEHILSTEDSKQGQTPVLSR